MSEGIVLIAIGHPMYAHMAFNLAMSIRYHAPEIPISVIREKDSLNQLFQWQRDIFTSEIQIDISSLIRNDKVEYLKAKTFLYDLSPYDKTIFFDADTICSPYKNPTELFKLSGLVFANRGEVSDGNGISQWVNLKSFMAHYNLSHWYDLSSEFIYFEKSDLNKKFFDDAKLFYDDDSIPVVTFKEKHKEKKEGITEFGGGKPDEIPFGLAIEKNNIRFQSPYLPSYWQPQYVAKMIPDLRIQKEFYLISAGGNAIQKNIKRIYDNLCKYYCHKSKLNHIPYQLVAKSKIIPERKLI